MIFFQDRLTREVKKGNKKKNFKNKKIKGRKTKITKYMSHNRHRMGRCYLPEGYVEYKGCKKLTCVRQYKWSQKKNKYMKRKNWIELPA